MFNGNILKSKECIYKLKIPDLISGATPAKSGCRVTFFPFGSKNLYI